MSSDQRKILTLLLIVEDLDKDKDGDNINFIKIYDRPMYAAKMNGKPYSVMRDGYPGEEEHYFEIKYPANASTALVLTNMNLPMITLMMTFLKSTTYLHHFNS